MAEEEKTPQDDTATATPEPEDTATTDAATEADESEQPDKAAAAEAEDATEADEASTETATEADTDSDSDEAATAENGAAQETAEAQAEETEQAAPQQEQQQQQEKPAHRATVEDLLKAGAHYGHLTSRWHPRMKKHIFMERNNIHIIDLMQTQVLLDKAADAARRFSERGKDILFVGTKKQAQDIVRDNAVRVGQPHMAERWLGGTMTNFQTIRRSIRRMEEIEKMDKDGTLDKLKKKEKLVRLREHEKLETTLGGIRDLARLPGAIFVVDIRREKIAVREAQKLGIPVIAMVDTNCDPGRVEYPIPANDDALSSIDLVTTVIADAIEEGQQERQAKEQADQQQG